MLLTVALSCLLISVASAGECESRYSGSCVSLFHTCPTGYRHTLDYCGFLEQCCYQTTTPTHSPVVGPLHNAGQHNVDNCGLTALNSNHRIVGGTVAADGEFPWQVGLLYRGQQLCGGTLIDNQWVVSAAHCFDEVGGSHWTVALGISDIRHAYGSHVHNVAHIVRHASYSKHNNHNDISMLKLSSPVDLSGSHVRAACLPDASDNFEGVVCQATGWGATHEDGPSSRYLRKVDIPIITNNQCGYYLGRGIVSTNICGGYPQGGKDACQGDSGGPLVCLNHGRQVLSGITSWGIGCADRYKPGVYTRVSSFIDWIENVRSKY